MLLAVILYFLAATALLAVWLLPPVRAWTLDCTLGLVGGGRSVSRRWLGAGERLAVLAQGRSAAAMSAWRGLVQQRWRVAAALAVLLLAPAGALLLRAWHRFDGYDHTAARAVDERIAALLQGEQLVPPPALPPALFSAGELIAAKPLLPSASRQWELLDADFRQRLLLVFRQLKEHGYEAVLLEGYRSPQRQAALAALGPAVTQAAAFESYHQYGLAADVAFLRDGRIVISEADPWAQRGYALYGVAAESLGLHWGGRWRTLLDYGHVELRRAGAVQPATAARAP